MMRYLISYKIKDNKRRYKIKNILSLHGFAVNRCLFECKINNNNFDLFLEELLRLINAEDVVRIYPICKECYKKILGTQNIVPDKLEEGYLIY